MSTVNDHIARIYAELTALSNEHCGQPNEFIAVNDTEMAVHKIRQAFEQKEIFSLEG